MRVRSTAIVLGMSGLLAGSLVRCNLPELPPGPQAVPTRIGRVHGAVLSLNGATVDRPALIASMKELQLTRLIIEASADATGELVNDRVALAVELQRELDADVFIGTYQSTGLRGKPMEELLKRDPAFAKCYPPDGRELSADTVVIDKLRLCSQDVSKKIVEALRVANASPRIGCYITHQTELVESLTNEGRTKLEEFFRDSAGPCTAAGRFVGVSPLLSPRSGNPGRAGVLLRETLQDSGVNAVLLQDGVGTFEAGAPRLASAYYQGLRNALADRPPGADVVVWASIEAFDCETPSCTKTHPTTTKRFIEQLCGARARVDEIVTNEYLQDLAGKSLVTTSQDAAVDASASDAQAATDDTDAAAQLRKGYLEWADSGAPCP